VRTITVAYIIKVRSWEEKTELDRLLYEDYDVVFEKTDPNGRRLYVSEEFVKPLDPKVAARLEKKIEDKERELSGKGRESSENGP